MANMPHKINLSIAHQNLYLRAEVQSWPLVQVQQGAAVALMCNLSPGAPIEPVLWEGAGWGRTGGRHVLLSSVSCLFSSLTQDKTAL